MGNMFMTGFEWGTKDEITWSDSFQFCSIATDIVRSGNYSMKMFGFYAAFAVGFPSKMYGDIPANTDIFVQFAFYSQGGIGSNTQISTDLFHWYTFEGETRLGWLSISESGQCKFHVCDWSTGVEVTTVVAIGKKHLKTFKWYVFEVHIVMGTHEALLELRIDGNLEMAFYGATMYDQNGVLLKGQTKLTLGTGIDWLIWTNPNCYIDDIVINNANPGTSAKGMDYSNTSWPECLKVELLRPNSPGDFSQWIPSEEGWNYDMVNEVPYDPTTFISSTELGILDLYYFESLPKNAAVVSVVRGDAWCYKDSATSAQDRVLDFLVKPGLTIEQGSPQAIQLDYDLVTYPFDINPSSLESWTVEDVNYMQAGIEPAFSKMAQAYIFGESLTMVLYDPSVIV